MNVESLQPPIKHKQALKAGIIMIAAFTGQPSGKRSLERDRSASRTPKELAFIGEGTRSG